MISTEPQVNLQGRYDTKQTCAVLGISRRTLERHSAAGRIPHGVRKANGRPYYKGADIIRFWRASW